MNKINSSTRVFATMRSNSKQIKVYHVIELASTIGHTFCEVFPSFYAFTGSRTVPRMYNCSKTHFWDEFLKQPNILQLLEVFAELSNQPMAVTSEHVDILETFFGESFLSQKGKHEFINWWESSSFQTISSCQHQAASHFINWIDWAYEASIYPRWLVVGRMHCKGAKTRCYWMELAAWKWGWICPTMVNSWWNFHNWQCHTNMQLKKDNMQIVQMRQIRTCLSAILQMWEIFWKMICNPSL